MQPLPPHHLVALEKTLLQVGLQAWYKLSKLESPLDLSITSILSPTQALDTGLEEIWWTNEQGGTVGDCIHAKALCIVSGVLHWASKLLRCRTPLDHSLQIENE